MMPRILYVDDDPNILKAYQVRLQNRFEMHTATSGAEGMERLREHGPYAVVLADMRMPEMDGAAFLQAVRELYPETVRMMLTGDAEILSAVRAVNEGEIFRFLTKPCPHDLLARSLEAGAEQYRLVRAERDVLEQTLRGAIKALTEVLSLVNPAAFARTERVRRYVRHVVAELGAPEGWQYELAAMLSQVGAVSLLPATLDRAYSGQSMSAEEKEAFAFHPMVAHNLLARIPRLEVVAGMVRRQQEDIEALGGQKRPALARESEQLGAAMLRAALDFDHHVSSGDTARQAAAKLQARPEVYDREVAAALAGAPIQPENLHVRFLRLEDLDVHMVLGQDVWSNDGRLLVTSGQEVTYPMIVSLQRWADGPGIPQPIRVFAPLSTKPKLQPNRNAG